MGSNAWLHVRLYMSTSYHQNRGDDKDSDGSARSSINREKERERERASNDDDAISIG
jgi:hypothetical protein